MCRLIGTPNFILTHVPLNQIVWTQLISHKNIFGKLNLKWIFHFIISRRIAVREEIAKAITPASETLSKVKNTCDEVSYRTRQIKKLCVTQQEQKDSRNKQTPVFVPADNQENLELLIQTEFIVRILHH